MNCNGHHPVRAGAQDTRSNAFTLFEVLLVIFLLGLLAPFILPAMDGQFKANALPESADRIRSALFMSRSEAIMANRRYRLRFVPNASQPFLEIEPDPIHAAGKWAEAPQNWAREQLIMDGVQVVEIKPGRPSWLEPIANRSDAKTVQKDVTAAPGSDVPAVDVKDAANNFKDDDQKTDPVRPPIVFESDGSTDWATIILAAAPLNGPPEQIAAAQQLWIILDGRTGTATVRQRVTDEDLKNADFYVERDKLDLPDQSTAADNISLNTMMQNSAGAAAAAGGQQGSKGFTAPPSLKNPKTPGGQTPAGITPTTPQPKTPAANPSTNTMADLEKQLSNSDLTDEEKNKIRQAYQQEANQAVAQPKKQ